MTPAKVGPASEHPWQDDLVVGRRDEQDLRLQDQVKEYLQKRAEIWAQIDNIKAKGLGATEQELQQAKKLGAEMNEQSRQIGESAGLSYIKSRYPDADLIYPAPGAASRSGDFDQVWRVKDESGKVKYVVVEAKGGSSPLGRRQVSGGANPYAQQGSREYFESILNTMASNKASKSVGTTLNSAYQLGYVEYIVVRAPIIGRGESTAVVDIQVSEFILK